MGHLRQAAAQAVNTLWTVGHSTHSAERFQEVLQAHEIELVADVRRFPGSRRLPQFSQEALERDLADHGIAYRWLPQLGGRRSPGSDSPNTGWRHRAFRGYADHTLGDEFAEGLFELFMLAGGLRTAVMCAEVLWWRCHRRLIADVAVSLGVEVVHLRDTAPGELHRLGPPARLKKGILSYPAPA
jgi:uncharacterized protein (DUF488 family)